jgi:hypothetical protein
MFAQDRMKQAATSLEQSQQSDQEEDQIERRLWLLINRESKPPASNKTEYKRSKPRPPRPTNTIKTPAEALEETAVGITIWRVPPSAKDDSRATRIEANTPISAGDQIFLTVEAPHDGYLYVIDREKYADETFGEPDLIFPVTRIRNGDNHVKAGVLVRIPDLEAPELYFNVTSTTANHMGEALTIIIKPERIENLQIRATIRTLPKEQFEDWEKKWTSDADVEPFSLAGGADQKITAAEKVNSNEGKRKLTYDDPLPQIIYRLFVKRGNPIFVTLPLSLKRQS